MNEVQPEFEDKSQCTIEQIRDKWIVRNNGEHYELFMNKDGIWASPDFWVNGQPFLNDKHWFSDYASAFTALEESSLGRDFYCSYKKNARKVMTYDYQPSPPKERQILYCREGDFTITLPKGTFSDRLLRKNNEAHS